MENKEFSLHPITKFIRDYLLFEGSLWMSEDTLKRKAERNKVDLSSLNKVIDIGQIKKLTYDGINYYSTPQNHLIETEAAYNVMRTLYNDTMKKIPSRTIDALIDEVQEEIGITLHAQQREAVHTMVNNGFCVITGGPGTGKTCTLNTAVKVIERLFPGITIAFTAPTGKAAGRITESVKRPAKTIQRELKITYTKKEPDFFTGDILVIDEVSMLDMETAHSVFKALQNGQRIILIGDTEQLPSVGPGAILRDLLNSGAIPFTMLTKTFRQAEESALFANILKTKDGNPDLTSDGEEFVVHEALGKGKTQEQLVNIYCEEVEKVGIENVCMLVPYRKAGEICSNKLNNLIQEKVNPRSPGKKFMQARLETGEPVYYIVGDPVMQLVNRTECANGDVGKVVDVEGDRLVVKYNSPDGSIATVKYWKSELKEQLSLAYSMSINKSQGSEYKTVVMCMTTEHRAMLTRNMLYTGITRAKKRCVLVQEKKAIEIAMQNIAMYANEITDGRTTLFAEKLRTYKAIYDRAARYAA